MSTLSDVQSVAIAGTGSPRVVAVIVCSDRHSFLRRVLASEEHQAAIDEMSGEQVAVLHLPVANGTTRIRGNGTPGTLSALFVEWVEPWENKNVLHELGITSTASPLLVVYYESEGGILRTSTVTLSDESEEKARNRLLRICDELRKAAAGILPDNAQAGDCVFRVIDDSLDNIRTRDQLKRLWGILGELRKLKP